MQFKAIIRKCRCGCDLDDPRILQGRKITSLRTALLAPRGNLGGSPSNRVDGEGSAPGIQSFCSWCIAQFNGISQQCRVCCKLDTQLRDITNHPLMDDHRPVPCVTPATVTRGRSTYTPIRSAKARSLHRSSDADDERHSRSENQKLQAPGIPPTITKPDSTPVGSATRQSMLTHRRSDSDGSMTVSLTCSPLPILALSTRSGDSEDDEPPSRKGSQRSQQPAARAIPDEPELEPSSETGCNYGLRFDQKKFASFLRKADDAYPLRLDVDEKDFADSPVNASRAVQKKSLTSRHIVFDSLRLDVDEKKFDSPVPASRVAQRKGDLQSLGSSRINMNLLKEKLEKARQEMAARK
ncbi:hypothetical protein DFJ77DRAFT_217358 [Powellomyces hirtus]|nr:hypothetical protein DFJ77DRAFT_217358 [Powellomyces hirtus]